ncbi:MAG: hypothetical protein IKK38_08190 [Spirochaetaceae bacterium]|nr:hypothetical protein [Spirochaetaceae bacterium]MBR3813842.1 hypothetical protein [Spirochaetaceae bacterium]MDD6487043.1 hypothetical protein [Spirochaetales bacterium]
MTDSGKKFLWGVAAGLAAAAIMRTDTFRKGCSKIIAGGLQLKDDAKEYFETIKEDAEDVKAENVAKKAKA